MPTFFNQSVSTINMKKARNKYHRNVVISSDFQFVIKKVSSNHILDKYVYIKGTFSNNYLESHNFLECENHKT